MNETSYIKSIHRQLSTDVYRWKINDRFTNGVADTWYCGNNGKHLFVEYKFVALPVRPTTVIKPDLSPNQVTWLTERRDQGIPVAVIVGSDEGGVLIGDLTLATEGMTCKKFKSVMLSKKEIARTIEGLVLL